MQSGPEEQFGLYEKRIPIFPRSVKGRFRTFKSSVLLLAFSIYFLLPWMPWARPDAPAQAVLFDLPGRRFLIFGLTVYPQDVVWLALLLFIAATLLFFVTGLVGRAFCGYFCFQTLWTDFFIWIEQKLQGERPARLRLYKQAWNGEKLLKVGGTHALWVLAAFWTALTFVAYFTYAPELVTDFFTGNAAPAAYVAITVLTLSTYASAGLMREQICTYVCPYGRFQSVMYEPETLAVHYDVARGEGARGRAAARAGQRTQAERHEKGLGDCVDCGLCVQVCPTGIDIRDGLQYKCISCGLCIDACNTIMDSFNYPRGLIRYDSETNLASATPTAPKVKWKRLKTVGYGIALLLMTSYLVYSISTRGSFDRAVNQIRQPLYVVLSNGDIRNRYQIRITNKAEGAETYLISARGIPPTALDLGNFPEITVRPGHSGLVQASVRLSPQLAATTQRFEIVITPKGRADEARSEVVRFDSPGRRQ